MITSFCISQDLAAHITDRESVLKEITSTLNEYDRKTCLGSKGVDEQRYKANVQYLVYKTIERHEPTLVKVAHTSVLVCLDKAEVEAQVILTMDPNLHRLAESNSGMNRLQ